MNTVSAFNIQLHYLPVQSDTIRGKQWICLNTDNLYHLLNLTTKVDNRQQTTPIRHHSTVPDNFKRLVGLLGKIIPHSYSLPLIECYYDEEGRQPQSSAVQDKFKHLVGMLGKIIPHSYSLLTIEYYYWEEGGQPQSSTVPDNFKRLVGLLGKYHPTLFPNIS